ncbi:MAG: hypothetical protein L6405_01210 [Actinomycetia bacterium]|nr:hypothetical protein [Actinomycetes bacterium]
MLTIFVVTALICFGVKLNDLGNKSVEYKENKVDVTEYGDIKPEKDVDDEGVEKNKTGLKKIMADGIKIGVDSYNDTPLAPLAEELGLFKLKKKNIEEDKKTETNLKNSGLPSDPLNVGISKIVKAKMENNSTPGTSSEEIDAMMIETMEDIDEEEKLFDSTENDLDDAVEEVDAIIDMVSHIEEILKTNNKLADQKIIDIKTSINKAESEKNYLEEIVKAHEDAEKEGGILSDTQGITAIKARLEDAEKTINDLKTKLQQYVDEQEEVSEEIIEDTSTDEEVSEETSEDTKEAPTINLKIVAGPTYSEADGVCYYRVKAYVTGDPYPGITFSKDSSGGAWGSATVQINLKDGGSYTLKATATNSEGSATDSIYLSWGCAVQDTEDTSTGGGGSTSTDDGGSCPYE